MARINMANEIAETELDLTTVKRVTQQAKSFGFETAYYAPIYRWRLSITDGHISKLNSSDFFPINNSDFFGQLKLTSATDDYQIALTLYDSDKCKVDVRKLHPFQFFVCKMKRMYSSGFKFHENCGFSMNGFNLNADESELSFKFCLPSVTNATVELYQEPAAMIEYRSPYQNVVVGKIDRFHEKMTKDNYDNIMSVSPRIYFGPGEQMVIVRFCRTKLLITPTTSLRGLTAILHMLSPSEPCVPPFYFAATFTIFSPKMNGKNFVHEACFRQDEINGQFSTLLAFDNELGPYVDDDILYYKVVFEPRGFLK